MSEPVFNLLRYDITIGTQESKTGGFLDQRQRREGLQTVRSLAAREFGGFTITAATGGWNNPVTGELVTESALVLTVAAPRQIGHDVVAEFARACGRFLNQHSVLLTLGEYAVILECFAE